MVFIYETFGKSHKYLNQQFFTAVPEEFLKPATPDYVVRDTDLFSFRLSNLKMTTANTTMAIQCERIKIIPKFLSD
jgi:hypothetical protein